MTNIDRARSLLLAEGWSPEEAEKVIECLRPVLDVVKPSKIETPSPVAPPPEGGTLEV